MYSQVAPPDSISECCMQDEGQRSSESQADGDRQECGALVDKPGRISEEKWLKFKHLKERRQTECKPSSKKRHEKRNRRRTDNDEGCTSQEEKKCKGDILKDNRKAWKELCSNIDANVHLSQDNIAKPKPKSKIEEQLDEAIKEGNFSKAEQLSDEISKQELGVKITNAVEMRECKKRKEMEEKLKNSRKKKKLLWGFEQKERWESKGNM